MTEQTEGQVPNWSGVPIVDSGRRSLRSDCCRLSFECPATYSSSRDRPVGGALMEWAERHEEARHD